MARIQPVALVRHAGKSLKQGYEGFAYASRDIVVPLALEELPHAMMAMPIAFIPSKAKFVLVALQGLFQDQNHLVAPDGRWQGSYIPAVYRARPFQLLGTADGQHILAVDEHSPLLVDGSEGERLFDETGKPAAVLTTALGFLKRLHEGRAASARVCDMLEKFQLIKPWSIQLSGPYGEKTIQGLYCIDELALNTVPIEGVIQLRNAGVLSVAYCQMLSMSNLSVLTQLIDAHADAARQETLEGLPGDLDLNFTQGSGSISFE